MTRPRPFLVLPTLAAMLTTFAAMSPGSEPTTADDEELFFFFGPYSWHD